MLLTRVLLWPSFSEHVLSSSMHVCDKFELYCNDKYPGLRVSEQMARV